MRNRPCQVFAFSVLATAACNLSTESPGQAEAAALTADGGAGSAPSAPAPAPSATPGSSAAPNAPAAADEGAAFTISNATDTNEVLVIRRDPSGALSNAGRFATGGKGTGAGLGSQGALALSDDGRFLVAVDPGSNEITSFAVKGTDLHVLSRVPSNGVMPVSVTMHGNLVYALNGGGTSCIAGFRMNATGQLSAIADSVRTLSAPNVGPAQVSFSPKGDVLVVTEKGTNMIDTFVVRTDGTPSYGAANASAGKTPFGFAFTPHGDLIVSEAFGGTAGAGAMSSYTIGALRSDGAGGMERDPSVVSASVPDHQGAPCWVAVTANGRWAFTSNAASGNVSAYRVAADGSIALVGDGNAGSTGGGSKPIDIALDRSTKHLLVLNGGSHTVVSFTAGADGALTPDVSAAWVPDTAAGLVAQ